MTHFVIANDAAMTDMTTKTLGIKESSVVQNSTGDRRILL